MTGNTDVEWGTGGQGLQRGEWSLSAGLSRMGCWQLGICGDCGFRPRLADKHSNNLLPKPLRKNGRTTHWGVRSNEKTPILSSAINARTHGSARAPAKNGCQQLRHACGAGGVSIGAALIPPDRVKKMFKLDLSHAGYVVIEVGVFPAPGKDVNLSPGDFTLYVVGDKDVALRSVSADTITEGVVNRSHQQPRLPSPLPANTSVGVGHGAGGPRTETDVGVGIGGPAPQPCPAYGCDHQTADAIAQDLWEKSLPDGRTAHPVSGYLYFPRPARKQKNAAWELRYENVDSKIRLPLPR
jgi:hypothetical protein